MTIDEAIKEEQTLYDIAKDKYETLGIKNCLKRMEEHKQYIEWLEELKELREKNETLKALYEDARKEGNNLLKRERNKAIDDFADKIISLCDDGEFMNRFNEFTATTILETAEQLKAGEIYD